MTATKTGRGRILDFAIIPFGKQGASVAVERLLKKHSPVDLMVVAATKEASTSHFDGIRPTRRGCRKSITELFAFDATDANGPAPQAALQTMIVNPFAKPSRKQEKAWMASE